MGLVEQIYNRARRRYGDSAGSSHPAKLLQDELRESLMVSGQSLRSLIVVFAR